MSLPANSRHALVAQAAADLPRAITARWAGQCPVCKTWWRQGAAIARLPDGKMGHVLCAHRNDASARMKARREQLKAAKANQESSTH